MWNFNGSVCLVTGGTSGLGKAIALEFARQGALVTVGSTNPEKVERMGVELGDDHMAIQLDVTDETSVRRAVSSTTEQRGRLDVLVNAGGITQRIPSVDMSLDDWDRMLRINLTGTFLACREAAKAMRTQKPRQNGEQGCILNISSVIAQVGFKDVAAYGCSKAAVNHLTKSLANDWADLGIRVNAIAPGVFPTDLNRSLIHGTPRGEALLARTPSGRFGRHEEIVGAALYLCSDAATFTTGVVLPVDGGFLAHGVGV